MRTRTIAAYAAAAALALGTGPLAAPATAAGHAGSAVDRTSQARPHFCNRNTYDTKVRYVSGSRSIGISRIWVHTYPGQTTIHRGETVTTIHRKTYHAQVSTTVGSSISAGAMLKKVVNVFAEVHGETGLRTSIGSTYSETRTVTSDTTTRIPAGKTVVWFVGHKVVSGTFQYSTCNALDGSDPNIGVVKWRDSKWQSFAIRDDGGQRCDFAPNTSVAKAAKRIGCDA